MGYVIYLSTEEKNSTNFNEYGYWEGKTFTVQGDIFPITDTKITSDTKVYKSKIRAEKMAEKLFERCGYIISWKIEEVSS